MSNKRRNTSSPECDSPAQRRKATLDHGIPVQDEEVYDESDNEDVNDVYEQPSLDASTGQAGAFPGLTAGTDELFYGPADNGIDYLRMVRSEATGIPQLLRAQVEAAETSDEQGQETGEVDGGYWDEDGTYTAKPDMSMRDAENMMPKAQLKYYESLLAQFALTRATLNCVPPVEAIAQLTSSQPISFPAETKNARTTWLRCLKTQHPHPVQISCMDADSVMQLLRLITLKLRGLYQVDEVEKIERINAWVWAMLGKCQDRGMLGSEEMADLRYFAQKAANVREWLQAKSRPKFQPENTSDSEEEEDEDEVEMNMTSDIRAAKQRILADLDDSLTSTESQAINLKGNDAVSSEERSTLLIKKRVALDMVITVVGELYGQRDLLDLRAKWADR